MYRASVDVCSNVVEDNFIGFTRVYDRVEKPPSLCDSVGYAISVNPNDSISLLYRYVGRLEVYVFKQTLASCPILWRYEGAGLDDNNVFYNILRKRKVDG